jgi:Cof subfamily protein (haloacid dehalogenase superfamily)
MIKAIATDLDGTLFYPKRRLRLIQSDNKKFLKEFVDSGKKLILVTGRNAHVSHKVAEACKIDIKDITIVGCNGAFVSEGGKIVECHSLDHQKAKEIYDYLSKDKRVKTLMMFTDSINMHVNSKGLNPIERFVGIIGLNLQGAYYEPFKMKRKYAQQMLDDENVNIFKIMPWYGYAKNSREIARNVTIELKEKFGDFFEIAWSHDAVEIMPKGIDKAIVLERILKERGIEKEEVLYVGDSGNDISCFREFPNSFVMEQAQDEVKKEAKYIIKSVAELKNYCK